MKISSLFAGAAERPDALKEQIVEYLRQCVTIQPRKDDLALVVD